MSEAESKPSKPQSTSKGSSAKTTSKSESPKVEPKEPAYTTAIVYNGKREVRRYEVSVHGKNFADLAHQFASDRDYRVEMRVAEPQVTCPSCHYKFSV